MVYDFRGGFKPKRRMWAEEQRMLCETLILAIKIKSRIPVASICELYELMIDLNQKMVETSELRCTALLAQKASAGFVCKKAMPSL